MRALATLLLLIGWLVVGCKEKAPAFSGTFVSEETGATLEINAKTFTLTIGEEKVEGETSEMAGKLYLHPKMYNGVDEDAATRQAFYDAEKLGKQTDMMRLTSIFENTELLISEDRNTLTPEQKPPMKGGGSSFWNTLGSFKRK